MVSSSPQLAPDKLSGAAAGSRRAERRAREYMSSVGSWPVSAIQHRIASYAK
jgi:hypothetical protein